MKFKKREKIKKLNSINLALLRYFLLLAILLTLLLEVTCYIVVSRTSDAQARARISRAGNEIALHFIGGYEDERISAEMRELRREGINFYLLTKEGNVLLPFGYESDTEAGEIITRIISELEKQEQGGSVLFNENYNLVFAKTVPYAGQNSYLVAYYSMRIFKGSMQVMLLYFIIIVVIVLLIAALI